MDDQTSQLSIADLAVLRNVIDLAAKRGAFQAGEMKAVGEIYDKLTTFLDTVIKQAESQQAESQSKGETND